MVVNNDFVNFRNLSDLKKYAKEHNIFDSNGMTNFHRDYIPNLADDNFNEHYYLNKKYNGKTPLELANYRATYLAGIEKLKYEHKITDTEVYDAKKILLDVLAKERAEVAELTEISHKNLYTDNNPLYNTDKNLLRKKIYNVELNKKTLSNVLESNIRKVANSSAANMIENEKMPGKKFDFVRNLNRSIENENSPVDLKTWEAEREERSIREQKLADSFNRKDYDKWLAEGFKNVLKKTIHIKDPLEKEKAEKKLIGAWAFTNDYEKNQLKEFKNKKLNEINEIKIDIKETEGFFSPKKKELKKKLKEAKKRHIKEETELRNQIRDNRMSEYRKIKEDNRIDALANFDDSVAGKTASLSVLDRIENSIEKREISVISQQSKLVANKILNMIEGQTSTRQKD
ncbi:MAG: hypothetical protein Ta2D_07180 [Rickettsiales bacterium]|nr:MAG: hypothetical protein Ta2D_07180 [Rickettsiales bacterium]